VSEIAESPQPDEEKLHQRLVERIIADLRPVRRLWPLSYRLALWIALVVGVLFLTINDTRRTDLVHQIHNPWFILGVAGFAVAGVIGASFALRAAVPGHEPRATEVGFLLVIAVASALLLLHEPFNSSLSFGKFIDTGLPCALEILMFAALPWIALSWSVRRGAPLSPRLDGALIGAAAFLLSFAQMRVICPIDEGLHLLMWHFLPAVAGIALSAFVGTVLFKRRSRAAGVAARPW
jgi:hypothetical protein